MMANICDQVEEYKGILALLLLGLVILALYIDAFWEDKGGK